MNLQAVIEHGIQRAGICEGMEFIDCPDRNKCLIENIELKLKFKVES